MLQSACNIDFQATPSFVSGEREAALLEITAELLMRYGHAVPAAIVDDVLAGTMMTLPRNTDGSVLVRDYAEWHISLGEEMERELANY